MGTKTNLKTLKNLYLNKQVVYAKLGSRNGWTGTITSIFVKKGTHFTVTYNNGVEQSYRMDAIHYEPKSWGAHDTYINLI